MKQPPKTLQLLAILLVTSLFAYSVNAAAKTAKATKTVASQLDNFMNDLQSLQADFRQVLKDGQGRVIEESKGVLAIHRPNRFRWDYVVPHEQTIVADGKRLWLYDVDLEQVTVRPLEQSLAGTPAALLSSAEDLRSSFKVQKMENRGNSAVFTLTPKRADTDFKSVKIKFMDRQLQSMELADKLGQTTALEFINVQRNPPSLDDTKFVFTPPEGVDVIGADVSKQ